MRAVRSRHTVSLLPDSLAEVKEILARHCLAWAFVARQKKELLYQTVRHVLCVALISGSAALLANPRLLSAPLLKWSLNMNFYSSSCSRRVSRVSCSLILKMKLVPPSLPRSTWENQQQQRWLCRQILLPRPRRLRPRDPWEMQLKLQQTGEGAGESPAP